jgi:hypothetical protein
MTAPYEYPLTPGLVVSFQRFVRPPGGLLRGLPASQGALPLLVAEPGRVLVPVPDGEALWIGLLRMHRSPGCAVRVAATLLSGAVVDVWTNRTPEGQPPPAPGWMAVPPHFAVAGLAHPDGWAPLTRQPWPDRPEDRDRPPSCSRLEVVAWTRGAGEEPHQAVLRADLVTVAAFVAAGGEAPAAPEPSGPGRPATHGRP